MNANTKFGVKEVMDVILYDMQTNKPVIFFDTLKTSNLEMTSEKVYARGGKGNSKLITWELNKEGKLTIEDALLSPKSLELISGIDGKTGTKSIYMRQSTVVDPADSESAYTTTPLTVDADGKITLAYEPDCNVDDITVYLAKDDCGTAISVTEKAGNTITVENVTVGEAVIVYYTFASNDTTQQFIIDSARFSSTYKLVGNTVIRNSETGADEAFQIVIPNLKWSSNLTLNFAAEGDPQPLSFECEILKDPHSTTMVEMTRWD